jgi:hypothetical protein
MKLALLLLLLGNLALFAWQQGAFGPAAVAGREPQRLARQVAAEKIRVLSPDQVAALRGGSKAASNGSAGLACLELGDFDDASLARIQSRLAALALGDRLRARRVDAPARAAAAQATRFEIRGVDAALAQQLAEIQKEFPQSQLGACGN